MLDRGGPGPGTSAPAAGSRPILRRGELGHRLLDLVRSAVSDPAEAWEIPVRRLDTAWLQGRPFRPTKPDEVPPAALPSLVTACGPLLLDRLFVVPRTTRLVAPGKCVLTPTSVLGFGERAVALWIDEGPDGRLVAIPIERLRAIEDRRILLYGRLGFIAAETRLVLRYNTAERRALGDNLRDLRHRIAPPGPPTADGFLWLDHHGQSRARSELPVKWRYVLSSPAVLADPQEPAIVAVGDVAETQRGRSGPASGIAVLASRELVIAVEPIGYVEAERYGVDLLAVPRAHLAGIGWNGRSVTVRVGRAGAEVASVRLPLDARLVEAMQRSFGSAVPWE
jgi:hypothetical protein